MVGQAVLSRVKQAFGKKEASAPSASRAPIGKGITAPGPGATTPTRADAHLAPGGGLEKQLQPREGARAKTPGPSLASAFGTAWTGASTPGRDPRDARLGRHRDQLPPSDYVSMEVGMPPGQAVIAQSYSDLFGNALQGAPTRGDDAHISDGKREVTEDAPDAHTPAPSTPAHRESDLAKMRKAAMANVLSPGRDELRPDEKSREGYATLPILSTQRWLDEAHGMSPGFDTVYHYADQTDLEAHSGGSKQDTRRNDFIVEIKNGKFVFGKTQAELESATLPVPGFLARNKLNARKEELGRALTPEETDDVKRELKAAGGRYIFVMDNQGTIYAGESLHGVQHHSSFMGGGAVAAAGELVVSAGTLKLVSNQSGHYQPGPGYLWQAISQMAAQGVDMSGVTAEIMDVGPLNAAEFLKVFDPIADASLMDGWHGIQHLRQVLARGNGKEEITPNDQVGPTAHAAPSADVTGPGASSFYATPAKKGATSPQAPSDASHQPLDKDNFVYV